MAAAIALHAVDAGQRVLCVDAGAGGDVARALGARSGVAVLALRPEESLREYLRIYFKVPRLARLTPLARVFDFVATGVPGIQEMLTVGKIAYEERRRDGTRPRWDLIVVDAAATGGVLPQLGAARSMMELAPGGVIRAQAAWVEETLTDPARTSMVICALPEEMAVVEAIELHRRARDVLGMGIGAIVLNRVFPVPVTARDVELAGRHGAPPALLEEGVRLAYRLRRAAAGYARVLRSRTGVPVLQVPLQAGIEARPGMTAAVAASLAGGPP